MKKLMLIAAAALSVSAAQAVTVDWSNTDEVTGATITKAVTSTSGTGSGTLTVSSTSAWTVVLTGTFSNFVERGQFATILLASTSAGSYSGMRTTNTNYILPVLNGSASWSNGTYNISGFANGTHEFALSYDGNGTLTLYVDGTAFSSFAYTPSDTITYYYGQNESSGQSLTNRITYTADVYTVTGATYSDLIIATVPEPTCLALLALGVAGLALRRRA